MGEQIGVSGETYRKLDKVMRTAGEEVDIPDVETAPLDVDEEVREYAQRQVEKMEEDGRSINMAWGNIKERQEEVEQERVVESVEEIIDAESESEYDIETGDVWQLGDHILYCGDTSSQEFQDLVPDCSAAFADPPYNADAAEWDSDFNWKHDWLLDKAEMVGVTPGIFSVASWIDLLCSAGV